MPSAKWSTMLWIILRQRKCERGHIGQLRAAETRDIRIIWSSDSLAYGPEGCLSVPDRRGDVLRSQEIIVEYALTQHPKWSVRDTIRGYTAVIFQHEVDHLDGILYTDRL